MNSDALNRIIMTVATIWGLAGLLTIVFDLIAGWWNR